MTGVKLLCQIPAVKNTIVNWSLDITTIPEPGVWALLGFGQILLVRQAKFGRRKTVC